MTPAPVPSERTGPEGPVRCGDVADTLRLFVGVWHDVVQAYAPDGSPLAYDEHGGSPGPVPYEQLVYLDFDGERYAQTNVVLRGRPDHQRSFGGRIEDGVLVFDRLGPEAPRMLGVSGGPGVLVFLPERVDGEHITRFYDPDYIRHLGGHQRTRTTTLYRDGVLRRVLTVTGTRISTDPSVRVPIDPRGPAGPVHDGDRITHVYTGAGTTDPTVPAPTTPAPDAVSQTTTAHPSAPEQP